ncbi:unnamed protein product, partial [marine sediment metagenome]
RSADIDLGVVQKHYRNYAGVSCNPDTLYCTLDVTGAVQADVYSSVIYISFLIKLEN